MKKKGQSSIAIVGFLLISLVIIFITYIVAIPMAKVWDDVSAELKSPEAFGEDNRTVEVLEDYDNFVTPAFDQAITIGFIGMVLALIVTSIFFRDHPVFIVFLVIGFIIVIIIGSQLVNVADTAVRSDGLDNKIDDFTLAPLIFGNALPIILLIAGVTSIIIIMSKKTGVA